MKRKTNNLNQISNKGFTVVELVVVLILMTILLSLIIFGGLAWQDWARFKNENETAEDIFYAMQNQLTEYENGGATEQRVILPLQQGGGTTGPNGFDAEYVLAYYTAGIPGQQGAISGYDKLNQIKDDNSGSYDWNSIWETQTVVGDVIGTNKNSNRESRTIVKLTALSGDYSGKYLPYKAGNGTADSLDLSAGTILLFDLVSPYLADSSVLDGSIAVEFCPETGQVFSALYSDRLKSGKGFLYEGGDSDGNVSVLDRTEANRRDHQVGYFNVDKLSEKIKGRSVSQSNLTLEIINKEILYLKLTDNATGDDRLKDGDKLNFVLFNGTNNNVEGSGVMSFSLDYSEASNHTTFADALANPMDVTVTLNEGLWKDMEGGTDFRIPVWVDGNHTYILLDGADVQAGTSAMTAAFKAADKNSNEAKAFRNTYSFYRFGLKGVVDYIHASVTLKGTGRVDSDPVYSKGNLLSAVDPTGGSYHKDSAGAEGKYGVCTTFATVKDETDNARGTAVTRTIKNARHLYNMRYETEYKENDENAKNTKYVLADNVDWNDFINVSNSELGQNVNFFLNSFPAVQGSQTDPAGYGINYDGNSKATGGNGEKNQMVRSSMADMRTYPFPGFRCLGRGDVFTQATQFEYYVKNLKISLAANILYGVYDDVLDGTRYETQDIKSGIKDNCYAGGAFAGLAGMKNVEYPSNPTIELSTDANLARGGALPLGLFAENLGEISDIALIDHTVTGIEKGLSVSGMTTNVDGVLATNMVGGFAGNNLGTISNLRLTGESYVSGRTDVGGIIGRESFVVTDKNDNKAETDITISGMYNEATVTGLENVGGIVGRAYTHYLGENNQENDYNSSPYKFGNNVYSTVRENPRYSYYHDRYFITDKNVSMTGAKVARVRRIVIEECKNRGIVSGDSAFAGKIVTSKGNETVQAKCSFIGGIAGITMDGFILDERNIRIDGNKTPLTVYYELGIANGNKENSYVVLQNCNSYSDNKYTGVASVRDDYYKGDLVGYARLTTFVDCDNKPDDYNDTTKQASAYFVTGKRYVGGLIGCSDACGYKTEKDGGYSVVNYNNVIGERYVGGITGGFGIGDNKQQEFSFWQPACAPADGLVSQYEVNKNNATYLGMINSAPLLNCGVVLGVKNNGERYTEVSNKDANKDNTNGCIGGIAGITRMPLSDIHNIQSDAVKEYAKQLIGNGDYGTADGVQNIIANSAYGGNEVGGLIGHCGGFDWFNNTANCSATVDAIVYGENFVGGSFGYVWKNKGMKNAYPEGSLIIGRDGVGGLYGYINNPEAGDGLYNRSINKPFTVIGRYAVGGLFGIMYSGQSYPAISVDPNMTGKIQVKGIAYAGGVAGLKEKNVSLPNNWNGIHISNTDVSAKYFAGAVYGAETMNNFAEITGKKVTADQTVTVSADAFAGGISGLFAHENKLFTAKGTLYTFANTVAGKEYTAAYADAILYNWPENTAVSLNFPDYAAGTGYSSDSVVTANLFAGGLYGFVPDHQNISISGFVNGSTLTTEKSVSGVAESTDKNAKYSYLGGITGRIPRGTTVSSCSNPMVRINKGTSESPDYKCLYTSKEASYLGGLTEVNAGTIESCNNTISFIYTDFAGTVAPFAGVNGVLNLTDKDKQARSAALIRNCTNGTANNPGLAQINSGGHASGIVGATDGRSQVDSCENNGQITAMINTNGGTAAGIVAFSTNDNNSDFDEVHNIYKCTNTGEINGYSNASGILGLAADSELNRVVNSISECVNYGSVGNKQGNTENAEGKATGIAISTANGSIEYCRNYGTIVNKDEMGITCSSTSRLYGNLVSNGFSEQNSKHPLAPDDRPAEPNDGNHIRNFYVSNASTDEGDTPDNLMTVGLDPGFWDINTMILNYDYYDGNGVENYINTLLTTEVRNGFGWHKEELVIKYLGITRPNADALWNYCLIKYFQPDETQKAEGTTNYDLFMDYTLILYGAFCRNNPDVAPDQPEQIYDRFYNYVNHVIATANLNPSDDAPGNTFELEIAKGVKDIELDTSGNPYSWNTYGLAQRFVDYPGETADPELAYLYFLPAEKGGFGHSHLDFGNFVNNVYRQFRKDGFVDPTDPNNDAVFVSYLKKLVKYGEIPTSPDDSSSGGSGEDKSHWPVQLYTEGTGSNIKLKYKRIELHDAGISDWDGAASSLDAKFITMAKGDTPRNYSAAGEESLGFVKLTTTAGRNMLGRQVFSFGAEASKILEDVEDIRIKEEEEAKKKAEEEAKKAEEKAKKKAEEEAKKAEEQKISEPVTDETGTGDSQKDNPQDKESVTDETLTEEPQNIDSQGSEPGTDGAATGGQTDGESQNPENQSGESQKEEPADNQDASDSEDPGNQPVQNNGNNEVIQNPEPVQKTDETPENNPEEG